MKLSAGQWLLLVVFLVAYGAVVSLVTRSYYVTEPPLASARPAPPGAAARTPPTSSLNETARRFGLTPVAPPGVESVPAPGAATLEEFVNLGDGFFEARQFAAAALAYERALALAPGDAELHNNLGLTLHYVGRSAEALATLREGVARDPSHQRAWLTLGFVSLQTGNAAQARESLQRALELGPGTPVGVEAQRLLGAMAAPAP